jgi:predicted alpha-1,6-mannanase (GH76 family)
MSISLNGDSILGITQTAIDVFLQSKRDDGLIQGLTYWQVANGYTAIALHDTWTNTTTFSDQLDELIGKVEANQPDCINDMNDDSMWWAICSLDMFELTHQPKYLNMSEAIWEHVSRYVIPHGKYVINGVDMEGGVMWSNKTAETQVNSITTGLYAELSARLSRFSQADDEHSRRRFLSSAIHSFSWILRAMFDPDEYIVLDHIDLQSHQTYNWTFTYTTGQTITASLAIYHAMRRDTGLDLIQAQTAAAYLDLACTLASTAMTRGAWVDGNGTLTEPGAYPGTGPSRKHAYENDDAVGFKAILLRSLARLYRVLLRDGSRPEMRTRLLAFITQQYQSLQDRDTNGKGQYGPWWDGPMDLPTSHSQLAALDVMAAIHA